MSETPLPVRVARALARGPVIQPALVLVLRVDDAELTRTLKAMRRDGLVHRIPPAGAWALVSTTDDDLHGGNDR